MQTMLTKIGEESWKVVRKIAFQMRAYYTQAMRVTWYRTIEGKGVLAVKFPCLVLSIVLLTSLLCSYSSLNMWEFSDALLHSYIAPNYLNMGVSVWSRTTCHNLVTESWRHLPDQFPVPSRFQFQLKEISYIMWEIHNSLHVYRNSSCKRLLKM